VRFEPLKKYKKTMEAKKAGIAYSDNLSVSEIDNEFSGLDTGNKFTVNDPEAGTYTFPGSVYDTPELIASLTTDYDDEYHGTHTTAIAAGSISPLGFGGMAPEADIVLIPLNDVEVDGFEEAAEEEYVELALGFASAYAKQSNQPVVLSASMNSHGGPHDGTSPVTEAIESVSENLIPVFSAGDWTSTESVVSVGAYCANTTWRDYDGTTTDTSIPKYDEDGELEQEPDVLNDIAYFSSYGTSFNGVSQPTICAPGVNIVSAMSHYCAYGSYASNMQWQDYPYMAESGTSMACPVVSGIVALWLQANPDLTLTEIKDVMEHSARHDSFTTKNTERWGYGKIDAAKGIEYILQTYPSAIQCLDYATTQLDNNQLFDLQGRRLTKAPASGIYIKNGKKKVVK
jgi:subtilisin family serine protease